MPPASRPRVSWSPPRVGLMCSEVCSLKDIGRAPNLSWSASALAEAAVNWPVILAVPAHRDACATGGEITCLSSTMPNWLRGAGSDTSREVTLQKAVVPAELKLRTTSFGPVEPPALCTWSEVAFAIWSPLTSAGPRMNFSVPSAEQATMGKLGLSTIASMLVGFDEHLNASN